MKLNDEVFLSRLKTIVAELKTKQFYTILPAPRPETVDQYKERTERFWEFIMFTGEKVKEMETILELAEPEPFSKIFRNLDELIDAAKNLGWTAPPPFTETAIGRPARVSPIKPEDTKPEEANQE